MLTGILAVILLALTVKSDCTAAPVIFYYEISGKSSQDLRNTMAQKGPSFNNQIFDAVATWSVYYTFEPKLVTFYGKIEMPMLNDYCPAAKLEFMKYYNLLYGHELQHLEHGRQLCREMELVLEQATTQNQVQVEYTNRLQIAIEKDRQFDIITRNGDTQGACFNLNGCPPGNTLFQDTDSAFKQCSGVVVTTSVNAPTTTTLSTTTSGSQATENPSGESPHSPSTNNNNAGYLCPSLIFSLLITIINLY